MNNLYDIRLDFAAPVSLKTYQKADRLQFS